MKEHMFNKKGTHNINVISCNNLKGKCIFQKTLYIFRVVEIEVEHDDKHIMGFGLILG
jgi:hypothetical protein